MRFLLFVLFIFAVLVALFATQPANLEAALLQIPYVSLAITGPLLWMVTGFFAAGLALGYFAALPGRIGASRRARKAEKKLSTDSAGTSVPADAPPTSTAPAHSATTSTGGDVSDTQSIADDVAQRTRSATGTSATGTSATDSSTPASS